jgi:2-amino-4-hydroxy-6-hydroxymethyldihydropteridine diphosphokinase
VKNTAYLSLGSNIGDRSKNLKEAIARIEQNPECMIAAVSSFYETKPYGYAEQDNFINAVIKIETDLQLVELFNFIKNIEKEMGRLQRVKWGPRELDIDILFFNDEIRKSDELTVPHKGIIERDFVLIPLKEIAPDLIHPELVQKISDICKTIKENNIIRKI